MSDEVNDGPEQPDADDPKVATDGKPDLKPINGGKGANAMERGESEFTEPGEQVEMFYTEENGKRVTLGSLLQRSVPVEYKVQMTGKSVPGLSGGLIDPFQASAIGIVANAVIGDYKVAYTRDEDKAVNKIIVYITLKPYQIQSVGSEAGQVMLSEMLKTTEVFPALRDAATA